MPNGNKNNGKKAVELLPEELRKKEEQRAKEEKPEVKFFIPPEEEKKVAGPTLLKKFFGGRESKEEPGKDTQMTQKDKEKEEMAQGLFKMKEEKERRPLPSLKMEAPSPPPAPTRLPPKVIQKAPSVPPMAGKKSVVGGAVAPLGRKLGITLMPEEVISPKEKKGANKKIILVVVTIILLAILGGVFGVLKWYEARVLADLKKIESELAAINQQIDELKVQRDEAEILQQKLKVAGKLLGQHIYWTNFFDFLEKNTIPDVYFLNLAGNSDGNIILAGVAKSYSAVAKQILTFRTAQNIESVSTKSASANLDAAGKVSEVNFDTTIKLGDKFLEK